VNVFRNDLLKWNDRDPVEDDLPLWGRAALILAMVAAKDRLKETEDQEAVDNLSDTIRFFDGFTPLSLTEAASFLSGQHRGIRSRFDQPSAFQGTLGGQNTIDPLIGLCRLAQGAGKGLENRFGHMVIICTISEVDVQCYSAMI
jgi:hypothetical protein